LLDAGTEQAKAADEIGASGSTKLDVTINLLGDYKDGGIKHNVPSPADETDLTDVYVRRHYLFYSTFARRSRNGAVHRRMEAKLVRSKYQRFRGPFSQMSFLMLLGTLAHATTAAADGLWARCCILAGAVAPIYLLYGSLGLRGCLDYTDSATDRGLLASLSLQSIFVILSEWARPRLDYGMLVMHIGFTYNFTPLTAGSMHIASSIFGIFPYVLVKVLRHDGLVKVLIHSSTSSTSEVDDEIDACITTKGKASLVLEILVPCILLLYQMVVMSRKDESMRLDMLSGELLRVQQEFLDEENTKTEGLLMSMLPRAVIDALKANEPIEPQLFEDVTVIFVEICDFDALCARLAPAVVVQLLNLLYHEFDRLSDQLHVYKVETVGDVYMAVVGCPEAIANHADVAAHFALALQGSMAEHQDRIAFVQKMELPVGVPGIVVHPIPGQCTSQADTTVRIRVGLNSGRCRAGVVGLDSPRFKLFGDAVNTASRMESTCEPGKIQVSPSTKELLTEGMFILQDRGEIPVKGKGTIRTSFLTGYADQNGPADRSVVIKLSERTPVQQVASVTCSEEREKMVMHTSLTKNFVDSVAVEAKISSTKTRVGLAVPTAMAVGRTSKNAVTNLVRTGNNALLSAVNAVRSVQSETLSKSTRVLLGGDSGDQASQRGNMSKFDRLQLLFLLVPPSEKHPEWVRALQLDRPAFMELTLQDRIAFARNLTILWLLILSFVYSLDFFLDVLREDVDRYREVILYRAVGNSAVGLGYLLLLTSPVLFRKFAVRLTVTMLVAQGVAVVVSGAAIYNREPALVIIYGAFVLFYTVCNIRWRLVICFLAVVGYLVIEVVTCSWSFLSGTWKNIVFLLVFFSFTACSVHLEEHLAHVAHYEQRKVCDRLEETRRAKAAGYQLLVTLLPPHVVDLVSEGVSPIAEHHPQVTVIFTDIKGFTAYSSRISPIELVNMLNSMYSSFDEVIANWELHKVEIIGDAYFIAAGCPQPKEFAAPEYAMRAVEVGLALQRTMSQVADDASIQMRVGMHTGPVVAGVVGKKGPRYHLFGATVGYAEKMESSGIPGRVQISDATHALLASGGHSYDFEQRTVEIEGEDGPARTWLVNKSNAKAAFQIQKRLMIQRRSAR